MLNPKSNDPLKPVTLEGCFRMIIRERFLSLLSCASFFFSQIILKSIPENIHPWRVFIKILFPGHFPYSIHTETQPAIPATRGGAEPGGAFPSPPAQAVYPWRSSECRRRGLKILYVADWRTLPLNSFISQTLPLKNTISSCAEKRTTLFHLLNSKTSGPKYDR